MLLQRYGLLENVQRVSVRDETFICDVETAQIKKHRNDFLINTIDIYLSCYELFDECIFFEVGNLLIL